MCQHRLSFLAFTDQQTSTAGAGIGGLYRGRSGDECADDVLKIDRTFIEHTESNRDYAAVVHSIVSLASNLNMKVTAEGVETWDSLAQIIALGCDFVQGYLFSKPIEASAVVELMRSKPIWPEVLRVRDHPGHATTPLPLHAAAEAANVRAGHPDPAADRRDAA